MRNITKNEKRKECKGVNKTKISLAEFNRRYRDFNSGFPSYLQLCDLNFEKSLTSYNKFYNKRFNNLTGFGLVDNLYCVSDYTANKIYCYDRNKDFLSFEEYNVNKPIYMTSFGGKYIFYSTPSGIFQTEKNVSLIKHAYNKSNEIYSTIYPHQLVYAGVENKNEIHVFDSVLNLIDKIFIPDFYYPTRLAFDDDKKQLYISASNASNAFNPTIFVYDLKLKNIVQKVDSLCNKSIGGIFFQRVYKYLMVACHEQYLNKTRFKVFNATLLDERNEILHYRKPLYVIDIWLNDFNFVIAGRDKLLVNTIDFL